MQVENFSCISVPVFSFPVLGFPLAAAHFFAISVAPLSGCYWGHITQEINLKKTVTDDL
jgi:hypothetical protein